MLVFVARLPELVVLHTGGPYPDGWLKSDWHPEPAVILLSFALIAAYLWWTGPRNRSAGGTPVLPVSSGQRVAFVAGTLVYLVALNPPLEDWAGSYLLSAHMVQHMLLIFVVAPLWLAGMPTWLLRRLLIRRPVDRIGYALTRPVIAFAVSSLTVSVWHMPFAYDAALGSTPVHILQHLSFLAAALLSWWPVLGKLAEWPGLSKPMQCIYLFATSIPGGIVGSLVTLAEPGLYDYEASPRIWGISLATDQEIAGLLMWVGTSVIYLLAITVIFFQWAGEEEAKEGRALARSRAVEPAARGADLAS